MTHTYPEINPADIKAGDTIRWESEAAHIADSSDAVTALEYEAKGGAKKWRDWGTHYLVNRPTPPVKLPTEESLGRLTWYAGEESSGLGVERSRVGLFQPCGDGLTDNEMLGCFSASRIVSWEPMTAVPTSALDELRAEHEAIHNTLFMDPATRNRRRRVALDKFLADVDKANS